MLNENTKTATTTETRNPVMTAFEAHCRKIVEEAPARMTAMVRELSDIVEAAGEVGDIALMDAVGDCRAMLIRAIEGPEAIEREALRAWTKIPTDGEGRQARRALVAVIAHLSGYFDGNAVPGSHMFDGDHTKVVGYGGRKPLEPKAIARKRARNIIGSPADPFHVAIRPGAKVPAKTRRKVKRALDVANKAVRARKAKP